MNVRQDAVTIAGACVSFGCLTALAIPHPEWRALEHQYHVGSQIWLRAAPMELLCFAVLAVTVPLTIAGVVVLRDRAPG
jgi:hypothetical protein